MAEFKSRIPRHGLQPDEKIDIIYFILMYKVRTGSFPSETRVKKWWRKQD